MNQTEQMHVLASACINSNERIIDIDDDDLKRYKNKPENTSRRNIEVTEN